MEFALFLVTLMGIMLMPDFPAFHSGNAAGHAGQSEDDVDSGNSEDLLDEGEAGLFAANASNGLLDAAAEDGSVETADVDASEDLQSLKTEQSQLVEKSNDGDVAFAEVTDFDKGEDVLAISMDPAAVDGTLDVDVINSLNGEDSLVFVEAELLAVLRGTPDVSADDVMVKILTMAV